MYKDWAEKFDENNYEFNHEEKIGILLIHGFTNTTYEVKDLAIYLSSVNYYVKAQNLPGHGTSIDDCNNSLYSDWLTDVEQQVAEMSNHCNQLFVIGVSMGGALALHLASMFPLNGIVAAATVLTFKKHIKVNLFIPILNKIITSRFKGKKILGENIVSWGSYGYNKWPYIALNEYRKMTYQIIKELPKVKCPTLLIHSKSDITSLIKNYHLIKASISSESIDSLIVDRSPHTILDAGDDREIIFDAISSFIDKNIKH